VAQPWLKVSDEQLLLEGPCFDREGNLYATFGLGKIIKITPDKKVSEVFHSETIMMDGLAIHKDGRIFAACVSGEVVSINADGTGLVIRKPTWNGETLMPNDLAFDMNGNLYFTDFRGDPCNPIGGVYRLDASDDYHTIHLIAKGMAAANGISFSPSGSGLWIAETFGNRIFRIDLQPDGLKPKPLAGIIIAYRTIGYPAGPDSNRVDTAGNLYQAVSLQGRVIILNQFGNPVANVIVPERAEGKHLFTSNLAFRPGTNTAYLVTMGKGGAWIYTFPGLAPGLKLYSHQ
jgi:lactonase